MCQGGGRGLILINMDLIPSFAVDHTNLQPGIYVSRQDEVNGAVITTYDIRMTAPNHEPCLNPAAIHTIEHLVATYLRNLDGWKEKIIYWGPMGCLTGNYLILKGSYPCEEIRNLMITNNAFLEDLLSVNREYYKNFDKKLDKITVNTK